jgi:hypothetical protein
MICKMILNHYRYMVHTIIIMSPTYWSDDVWKAIRRRCPQEKISYDSFSEPIIREIYNFMSAERQEGRYTLLVVDDMTREMRKGPNDDAEKIYDRIVANNRHLNCTLIQSAQMVVHVAPEMRKNWDNVMMWKPINADELKHRYQVCGSMSMSQFESLLRYCSQQDHHFLYIKRLGTRRYFFHCFHPLKVDINGEIVQ